MNVIVLAGGYSPERDVSLSSGSLIANALIENGHKVLLLDLYKGLENLTSDFTHDLIVDLPAGFASFDSLFIDSNSSYRYSHTVPKIEPDLSQLKDEMNMGNVLIGKNVIDICRLADLVFIALHGDIGENGKLQAVFDTYDIKYTGTGYIGSLLAMDKDLSKQLMKSRRILTPDWILFNCKSDSYSKINDYIGFPCIIKPCSCGSSVGVSIVYNFEQLDEAVTAAKKYGNTLIIEKMISGREFSVGILDGVPLPVIEIILNEGFYDYANKYQIGFAKEICPAHLPEPITEKLQTTALQVHNLLRLGDYSRIDFILDKNDNAFCLEANTLPGMTPTSLLPQEAAAAGISYNELCDKIAKMA